MASELRDKVAIVTGAASGIGLASTEAMLAAGARVVLVDRDRATVERLCKTFGAAAIDRMLNLNVNVVMKNVHDVLPHMTERRTGDIIVTSSLAAHFPTPWEPVYASSKWAINCFVQTLRRQVFKHGIRVGSVSPGPVVSALLADWPQEKLREAKASGSLIEPGEVAEVIMFMLTRQRGLTIRDVIMMPSNFDL